MACLNPSSPFLHDYQKRKIKVEALLSRPETSCLTYILKLKCYWTHRASHWNADKREVPLERRGVWNGCIGAVIGVPEEKGEEQLPRVEGRVGAGREPEGQPGSADWAGARGAGAWTPGCASFPADGGAAFSARLRPPSLSSTRRLLQLPGRPVPSPGSRV